MIDALGNLEILARPTLAFFCSSKTPGDLIVRTYDTARALRNAGVTMIGGFHSPMERECLGLLLRGGQPIVICPARTIQRLHVATEWKPALAAGRLLLLSPFAEQDRRVTADLARARNEFVAAIADQVLITHAPEGSRTEKLARLVAGWGKPLLTLDDPRNGNLVALGAQPLRLADHADSDTL
jgi:predicted Rossmann fold nucleotide-binding protein DprA/Smf involved in DNA uptake